MDKPKPEKPYIFIRLAAGGAVEHTKYVRHTDGSAGFVADGFFHVHEGHADSWRTALEELIRLGFEEAGEAKARGALRADWEPTDPVSVESQTKGKGGSS